MHALATACSPGTYDPASGYERRRPEDTPLHRVLAACWPTSLINVIFGVLTVGGEPLTLQRLMGWVFFPIAVLMGAPLDEAQGLGSVLGTRIVLNELYGFEMIRELVASGQLSARTQGIATFAICGFSSISSIGILIGGLGALAPARKHDIARLGVRALVAATLANFASACVAGALL